MLYALVASILWIRLRCTRLGTCEGITKIIKLDSLHALLAAIFAAWALHSRQTFTLFFYEILTFSVSSCHALRQC